MWLIGVFVLVGVILGGLSSYLLVTFEQKWYKYITAIICTVGPSSLVGRIHRYFGAENFVLKQESTVFFLIAFILSFILGLKILIYFIKVENSEDIGVIRTRDIILGRKDYIETFYNARKKQIDERLNIPALEKRENEISVREQNAELRDKYLCEQFEKLKKRAKKDLFLTLPDKKPVILREDFIEEIPSFLDGFSQCINSIKQYMQSVKKENTEIDSEVLQAALANICMSVMTFLFGNSTQVRVHFRIYNVNTDYYELIVGMEGKEFIDYLTPIPYKDSMIEKSDLCHQALIKSLNSGSTKYNGNNSTIWKDYMTYSFYNIRHNDRPILSFGISVKNERRFKNQFYFLNFVKFEDYLNDNLTELNRITPIEKIMFNS